MLKTQKGRSSSGANLERNHALCACTWGLRVGRGLSLLFCPSVSHRQPLLRGPRMAQRISANSPALTSASSRCCQLYLTTEGQSGLLRGSLLAILPHLWRLTSLWWPGVLQRGYCEFSSPALSLHQALCICALGAVSLSPPALPLIFTQWRPVAKSCWGNGDFIFGWDSLGF